MIQYFFYNFSTVCFFVQFSFVLLSFHIHVNFTSLVLSREQQCAEGTTKNRSKYVIFDIAIRGQKTIYIFAIQCVVLFRCCTGLMFMRENLSPSTTILRLMCDSSFIFLFSLFLITFKAAGKYVCWVT